MQTNHQVGAPPPSDPTAAPSPLADALRDVAGHFDRAAIPGPDAIPYAVLGVRALVQALNVTTGQPEPHGAHMVVQSIRGAMNNVVEEARGGVEPDAVAVGMTAALHLASLFGFTQAENRQRTTVGVVADCLDHGLLIADILDADVRRRAIARRGGPFRRDIAIRRALAETGVGARRQ